MDIANIQQEVEKVVSENSTKVREIVIEHLAGSAINEMKDAMLRAYGDRIRLKKELNRVTKPDITTYDSDGNEVKQYSKEAMGSIRKVREELDNVESILNAALADTPDFSKLLKKYGNNKD